MKSLIKDLVLTCHDIVDMSESASINFSNRISYQLIAVFLLSIAQLVALINVI